MAPKTVLITGASTGIGRTCALYLTRRGWRIFAGVRRQADADSLQAAAPQGLHPLFIDVTERETLSRAATEVEQMIAPHGLDGLINNAGVVVAGPLEYLPLDKLRRQLEVNVLGQIAVTQTFLPLLRRNRGRIINISSISGRVALPFVGPYSASKFALEALTDSLRGELRPWGLEVISIQPGAINTPIWKKSISRGEALLAELPPEAQTQYGSRLQQLRSIITQTGNHGIPPERVAAVVMKALTVSRPKTRYLIGIDARLGALATWLPDRLRDWFITKLRT